MNTHPKDIRWKQRFSNFQKAFLLLREAAARGVHTLSDLEKDGVIQRFEYTYELAYNLLKDKMEADGLSLTVPVHPKNILRQAYQIEFINDIEVWFGMLKARNDMSHTYDQEASDAIVLTIADEYVPVLGALYDSLLPEYHEQ